LDGASPQGAGGAASSVARATDDVHVAKADREAFGVPLPGLGAVVGLQVVGGPAVAAERL